MDKTELVQYLRQNVPAEVLEQIVIVVAASYEKLVWSLPQQAYAASAEDAGQGADTVVDPNLSRRILDRLPLVLEAYLLSLAGEQIREEFQRGGLRPGESVILEQIRQVLKSCEKLQHLLWLRCLEGKDETTYSNPS